MAGYSGTPLPKKLGIKTGHRVALVAAPPGMRTTLGELPEEVRVSNGLRAGDPFDVILLFVKSRADLDRSFCAAVARLEPSGGLWVAWPKKSSGVCTDLTEDDAREIALREGLVDNKVCAIDETWSGLRCVIRVENRRKSLKTR